MLRDRLGRTILKLRVSVTDRCNLRCVYCMPAEGLVWKPRSEILTFEETARLVGVFAGLGIEEVRLTGGEPTLRADLPLLARMIAAVPGIRDLALSTNGIRLRQLARPLREAGVQRVNVSLDTLDPERFHELVRRDAFAKVIAGLEAALEAFEQVKVNVVAMRGKTEQEVLPFCELARAKGLEVRFIEFMPLDADHRWRREDVLTGAEIREIVRGRYEIVPDTGSDRHAPAKNWRFADAPGGVGFIDSVSEPFCGECDRIRITADGKLRTCLFSTGETDLRGPLRSGASDSELAELITAAVWEKEPGHRIGQPDFVPASRSMSEIGG